VAIGEASGSNELEFRRLLAELRNIDDPDAARAADDELVALGREAVLVKIQARATCIRREADDPVARAGIDPVGGGSGRGLAAAESAAGLEEGADFSGGALSAPNTGSANAERPSKGEEADRVGAWRK